MSRRKFIEGWLNREKCIRPHWTDSNIAKRLAKALKDWEFRRNTKYIKAYNAECGEE